VKEVVGVMRGRRGRREGIDSAVVSTRRCNSMGERKRKRVNEGRERWVSKEILQNLGVQKAKNRVLNLE